jgi:solute carrier family 44 protein 1 (choline transporter-like protein)/choline transporter-like protein 2/4/5
MRSRIQLAIAVNKVAAMFVYNTPAIVLLPVVQSIIGLVWCVTWALSITFLISQVPDSYTPTRAYATYAEAFGTEDTPGACTDKWPAGFVWKDTDNCLSTGNSTLPNCWRCAPPRFILDARFAYSFFSFLWNNAFLVACGQCTIAGAVGIWFFAKHSEKRNVKKIRIAIWNVVRYHSGSLAFGSLILAIVQFIKYFMQYLEKQEQAKKNRVTACVFQMISWLLYCFEKCIKFINKNAYIQVALLGTNFCTSAKAAFQLILRNFARFGLIGALGKVTAFIGYTFITLATSICGYFILRATYPEANPVAPMIVFVLAGYLVGRLYMAVFGMAVDTALQCYIISEEFGGEPTDEKEQYVPGPLKKLLPNSDKQTLQSK